MNTEEKKGLFARLLLLVLLILTAISRALAESWITDGATAYETIQKINHWQGLTAAAIAIAALTAIWKIKPHPLKVVSYARAGVLWMAIVMGGGFFLAEYWPAFSFVGEQVVELFKAMT